MYIHGTGKLHEKHRFNSFADIIESRDGSTGNHQKTLHTMGDQDIPLCARIMAIADVFDAVSAKRCYRDAMTLEQSFKIIEEGSGTAFEPLLVDVFMELRDEVIKVHDTMQEL